MYVSLMKRRTWHIVVVVLEQVVLQSILSWISVLAG
jgi:hypothetical protein